MCGALVQAPDTWIWRNRQKIADSAYENYTLSMNALKNYAYIVLVTAVTSYVLTNVGAALL